MAETKTIIFLLGNVLGFGTVVLAWITAAEGWKQNILFALAVIFFVIKIGVGIIELLKKKYSTKRSFILQEIESGNLKRKQNEKMV